MSKRQRALHFGCLPPEFHFYVIFAHYKIFTKIRVVEHICLHFFCHKRILLLFSPFKPYFSGEYFCKRVYRMCVIVTHVPVIENMPY